MYYNLVEFFFSLGMFINALLFIPQAYKIYRDDNAHSLSLITFAGFNFIQLTMILHGLLHDDWFLVAGMGLSLFTCALITIQIIMAKLRGRA